MEPDVRGTARIFVFAYDHGPVAKSAWCSIRE